VKPSTNVTLFPKRKPPAKTPPERDASHLCSWTSGSQQCRYPATLSSTTLGDGPWFCTFHFECASPSYGAEVVKASQDYGQEDLVASVRRRTLEQANAEAAAYCQAQGLHTTDQMRVHIAKAMPKVGSGGGSLDWARKIMARIQAGESLPMISEQKARQALGLPTIAEAERDKRTERDALEAQFPAMQALR